MEYNIRHNEELSRFETEVDGELGMVNYTQKDNMLVVTHTGVPPEIGGRGVAASLTKALLDYARQNELKVVPVCPYTRAYIQRHPDYEDIVADI